MFLGEWFSLSNCNASKIDANQCTKRIKERKLVYAGDTKKTNQRIRAKPSKWAEIITHNLPKTENVWIFENCFRANRSNHSHHAMTLRSERGNGVKQGQMTSNIIRWHPQQQNATTETRASAETTQSKSSIPTKRPKRDGWNKRNHQNKQKHRIDESKRG